MAQDQDEIAAQAAETTVALNPLVGVNRQELVGAVAMLLRRTATSPVATAKLAGRMTREGYKIARGRSEIQPDPKDRRFKDPAWKHNPFYKRGVQTYLAMQDGLHEWVGDLRLNEMEHARADFVMGMIVDALSPTNTLLGNPAARKRAIDSGGLSLMKGLKNAYDDLIHNGGMPAQVDKRPFKVGENLATTPGQVVWQNEILELIQYNPVTPEVYETPFLSIPPQINKFYASDLTPFTSVVLYLLSQGMQVFIVSWRNPTKEHRHWGLQDYVDSLIQASEAIRCITGAEKINVSGACSGGITTATFASTLAAAGDDRINTLTFQVCVLDPQPGDSELGQMVSPRSIEIARRYSRRKGILDGDSLARMFAWMRPNDLVWNYVVNNYLLGEDPPPYDVLFWNNDTTNLPAQLHSDYLDIGLSDPFARPGEVEVAGHLLDMTKIGVDTFITAGLTDHITPWRACYRTSQLLGDADVEFVLSSSGHLQSLINPPGNPKAKYFHNASDVLPQDPEAWVQGASKTEGSWWPRWAAWLQARSGPTKPAPQAPGNEDFPAIRPAPGAYVHD